MYFIRHGKHSSLWRFDWHLAFLTLIILAVLFGFTGWILTTLTESQTPIKFFYTAGKIFFLAALLLAVFGVILLLAELLRSLRSNNSKIDNIVEMIVRQNNLLSQIVQGVHLSDTVKEIVFHDTEQMELGEAVLVKIHQHDFDSAQAMIAAIEQNSRYSSLSARLKRMADKYRSATEDGRIQQIISHIETLFEQRRWTQAAAHISNLTTTFPHSEKAKTMPSRLREKKDLQKGELLNLWDQAVRDKNTDRSLEILKELDLYLTPAEALALQESASTVFKNKLHNLGVQFSVDVTEKKWVQALETGREIILCFPNSRMAVEIRGKLDILQDCARREQSKNPQPEK